jgi:hypothetical protein
VHGGVLRQRLASGLRLSPPAINMRWWVQLIGHFPFVGLPIVASIGSKRSTGG